MGQDHRTRKDMISHFLLYQMRKKEKMHPVTPFKSGALIFSITREHQLNVRAAIHCPGKYQAGNRAVDSFKTESLDS